MRRSARPEPDLPPGPPRDLVDLFSRLRASSGLANNQIARRAGLSPGYVSDLLRGHRTPSPHTAARIARTLGGGDQTEALARRLAESWQELNRYTARLARAGAGAAVPEETSGTAEETKPGPATEPAAASPPSPLSLPSPLVPSPAAWRWQSAARWLAGAGLSVLALVLAITDASLGSRGGAEWLTGSVTCLSGRPVVGVWIAAAAGQDDSGFAHLGPRPGIRAGAASGPAVTYTYRLPQSGPYVVHVGCGGTAGDWASRSFSGQLSASTARLRCGDHRPDAARGGSAPDGKCSA